MAKPTVEDRGFDEKLYRNEDTAVRTKDGAIERIVSGQKGKGDTKVIVGAGLVGSGAIYSPGDVKFDPEAMKQFLADPKNAELIDKLKVDGISVPQTKGKALDALNKGRGVYN